MKQFNITVKGVTYEVLVEEVPVGSAPSAPSVVAAPASATVTKAMPAATDATLLQIKAPMPGTVLSVSATPGTPVRNGEVLCTLEAMKMENDIAAPRDGIVDSVCVTKGASVESGDVLITLR